MGLGIPCSRAGSTVLIAMTPQSDQTAQVALRAFWRIAERWRLTVHEGAILLGLGNSDADSTRAGDVTSTTPETLVRVGHVLAIFKALHCMLPEPSADDWVRGGNTGEPFGGSAPLERMLRGGIDDLTAVRDYLESHLYR